MVMCVNVRQSFILKHILDYSDFAGAPEHIFIDLDTKMFHKQYDIDYRVGGNGEAVHKADNGLNAKMRRRKGRARTDEDS